MTIVKILKLIPLPARLPLVVILAGVIIGLIVTAIFDTPWIAIPIAGIGSFVVFYALGISGAFGWLYSWFEGGKS